MNFQQITDLTLTELGLGGFSTLTEIAIKGKEYGRLLYTEVHFPKQQMCDLLASPDFSKRAITYLRQINDPRRCALITASDVLKGWQEYDRKFLESGICTDKKLRYFELCIMNRLFCALLEKGATRDNLYNISSADEIFEATFLCE